MMLTVTVPDNNIPEREFIIDTLFDDFLGLEYCLKVETNRRDSTISFNNSELIIRDCFFNSHPAGLSYLTIDSLPKGVIYVSNEFLPESDIPVIYGTDELHIQENKVICGIDIFASSYFMLTRWEEFVSKVRDEHDRFPGKESLAFRSGFLHRPLVNEYVEMLWNILHRLGYSGTRRPRSFELVLTHDIDHLDYPNTFLVILGDFLKRRNIKLAAKHLQHYSKTFKNPYDTFNFILSTSEKLGLKSHFYFMSSVTGKQYDPEFYLTSRRFKSAISEIKKRGHIIGFHPGYYTYNDPETWASEKRLLAEAVRDNIVEGRQHFLRFDIAGTYHIWDKNNMEIDSTMGYSGNEGFRCGTGDTIHVFDFLSRKMLRIKERPLIVMDGTLKQYEPERSIEKIQYYLLVGKKYKSPLTFLFHNSSLYGDWEELGLHYYRSLTSHYQ